MSEKPIWIYVERYRSKSGNKRKYTEKRHVKLQKKGKKHMESKNDIEKMVEKTFNMKLI